MTSVTRHFYDSVRSRHLRQECSRSSGDVLHARQVTWVVVIDVGRLHEFHNAASDLLQTTVVRRGATDPVEHFAIRIVLHVWNAKAGGPGHTILRRHSPRVAGATGLLQGLSWRSAKLSVGHEGPPHVRDKPQGAYAKGTNVHASGAGRACPQSFV